jgi:hypothetical protein
MTSKRQNRYRRSAHLRTRRWAIGGQTGATSGVSAIIETAAATVVSKPSAACSLRSRYHARSWRSSVRASGWNITASRQYARPHLSEHLVGGHGRHGPILKAVQAGVKLGRPRAIPGVALEGLSRVAVVEAVEEFREQALPLAVGEGENLLGERRCGHALIIAAFGALGPSGVGGRLRDPQPTAPAPERQVFHTPGEWPVTEAAELRTPGGAAAGAMPEFLRITGCFPTPPTGKLGV